jgi:hypothetical protein
MLKLNILNRPAHRAVNDVMGQVGHHVTSTMVKRSGEITIHFCSAVKPVVTGTVRSRADRTAFTKEAVAFIRKYSANA